VISYHKKIGIQYIAVPYLDESLRPGSSGFSGAIRTIRSFGSLCRQAGITLLYHNHDFEFCRISGEYGLDFLYAAIPPEDLQTELDTCWVKYAGEDPASYIRKYAGRCPVVHLKDYAGGKGGSTPYALIGKEDSAVKTNNATFQFRPLGYGCQDIPSLVVAGLESGAKWFVVEQDLPLEGKPLEDARKSIGTLLKIS
jgi:sugar phosphate isomerase/epimerase